MTHRLLVIDNGSLTSHLVARRAEASGWNADVVPHAAPLPPLQPYGAVVLTGTEVPVTTGRFDALLPLVRDCPLPMLGICGGLHLIARACGAGLAERGAVVGKHEVEVLAAEPLFRDLPRVVQLFQRHRYEVEALPAGFRVLARSSSCELEAIAHRERPLFGVQAHVELRPHGARVLENFLQLAARRATTATASPEDRMTNRTGLRVSDATLRDSAHMAGVEFTPTDGAVISRLLVQSGVDLVEAGIVSRSAPHDCALVRSVIDTVGPERTMTVILVRDRRQVAADLELVRELGCRSVMLSIPTSPVHARLKLGSESRRLVLTTARNMIGMAKEADLETTFSAEDGARTDPEFLEEYVSVGAAAGADRFRLAETVSVLTPVTCAALVGRLVRAAGEMDVEMHSHDMLGLAVANALAAVDAGATWISATVNGLGERGGNTPLAQVLTLLRLNFGADHRDLSALTELSLQVAERSGVAASPTAGPTAPLAYAYEAAGQFKSPEAFEAVPPDLVGNRRQVRVRGRLKPSLLRACVDPELLEGRDVEALAAEIIAEALPATGEALTADDLTRLVHERSARVAT